MSSQAEKAEQLRALHKTARPLVLVNAWDVVSARIVEELGFPAIATTSAGVAWAEGFADGEHIPREHMLARVKRIARAVEVPVSADLEGGYGPTMDDAAATAKGAIEAGAVGLNFEDFKAGNSLIDIELQAARIGAMRNTGAKLGVPLVINARTDAYLARLGDSDAWRLAEAVRRGNRYLEAGADCVFVPGVVDERTISSLVLGINGPINILAGEAAPSVARLRELGVARLSVGSGGMSYALAQFRDMAASVRDGVRFEFAAHRISHAELNALFEGARVSRG